MAAATVNMPAIVLSGGPMLNGWWKGERTGSGMRSGRRARNWPPATSTTRSSSTRGRHRALDRPLQHHGHGLDHELAGRGARHVAARLRGDPGALSRARADRLRDRQAHRRDGARGPEALGHPDPRGLRERHRRQLGDRRLDQRADPHQRHRAAHRREADHRRLADDRLRRSAAGQHAAGRQISRRGVLPRRRRAGGDERIAASAGRIHDDALTVNGKTMGENVKRRRDRRTPT